VGDSPLAPRAKTRGARGLAVICAFSIAVGAIGFVAGRFVKSPAEIVAEASPPNPSLLTASVEFRPLASTLALAAVVEPVATSALGGLSPQTGQSPIVTGMPVKAGATVSSGTVVLEVSGRPQIVLRGGTPAYRDLSPGLVGRDVEALQRALTALGYETSKDAPGSFGAQTKASVRQMYLDRGYAPMVTGADALAAAVAAQVSAKRAVQDASLASAQLGAARAELLAADTTVNVARAHFGPEVPFGEVVFVSSLPAVVQSVDTAIGAVAKPGAVTLGSRALTLLCTLNAADQAAVRPGQSARILLATDASPRVGVVVAKAERPTASDEAAQSAPAGATYQVEVDPTAPISVAEIGQQARVVVTTAQTTSPVLVVPLSAITTQPDGVTVVYRVDRVANGAPVEVPIVVTAGLIGGGYVALAMVHGHLSAGDKVRIGGG
jgi:HlyD family secretion protein